MKWSVFVQYGIFLQVHAASDKLTQLCITAQFVETLYKYPQLVCLFAHMCVVILWNCSHLFEATACFCCLGAKRRHSFRVMRLPKVTCYLSTYASIAWRWLKDFIGHTMCVWVAGVGRTVGGMYAFKTQQTCIYNTGTSPSLWFISWQSLAVCHDFRSIQLHWLR